MADNDNKALPLAARLNPPLWLVVGLTLLVYGGALAWVTLSVRERIGKQIISRDAEVLDGVAVMLQYEELAGTGDLAKPELQFPVVLKASRIKGVIATRLYDPTGLPVTSFPANVTDGWLPAEQLARLRLLKPESRFEKHGNPASLFLEGTGLEVTNAPLLTVWVPLHGREHGRLAGVAEFALDGESVAAEFAQLDRNLEALAGCVFAVGAAIILMALIWAFRRLQSANILLLERTNSLLRANEELAIAAKSSAIGAVTANWLHDLKSPIFGLQTFVAGRANQQPGEKPDQDWQSAVRLTGQLQNSINEMMSLLRQNRGLEQEQISLPRLFTSLNERFASLALQRDVTLEFLLPPELMVAGPQANLIILILGNLVRNAVEVSPRGASVRLTAQMETGGLMVTVTDQGPGFPEALRKTLFRPCTSTKAGGSGVGLAISKQLARQLGAELRLTASTGQGCEFVLQLPHQLFDSRFSFSGGA